MADHKMWIALYSQTGSELKELSSIIGRKPNIVYTNNKAIAGHMSHEMIMNKISRYDEALITLHGYLRILPPEVCHLNILNGQ